MKFFEDLTGAMDVLNARIHGGIEAATNEPEGKMVVGSVLLAALGAVCLVQGDTDSGLLLLGVGGPMAFLTRPGRETTDSTAETGQQG